MRLPGVQGAMCGSGTTGLAGGSPDGLAGAMGPRGVDGWIPTEKQREIALDVTQIILDIVGIFEPTPFADLTNGLISIGRGDWVGAGLSGISVIPYIGDLAKAGKLPKAVQTLVEAIRMAERDAAFGRVLRPALENLKRVLDSIPENLSPELMGMVKRLKDPLDRFLGSSRLAARLNLTDRLILARMGSLQNIGHLVRHNIDTARSYFVRHGMSEKEMMEALSGMDVHSAIEILELRQGERLSSYMILPGGATELSKLNAAELAQLRPGQFFVKSGGGVGSESVGLARGNRVRVEFEVARPMSILKSKAASVNDTWTDGMQRWAGHPGLPQGTGTGRKVKTVIDVDPVTARVRIRPATNEAGAVLRDENQKLLTTMSVGTSGGGTQYFLPKSAQQGGGVALKVVVTGTSLQRNVRSLSGKLKE